MKRIGIYGGSFNPPHLGHRFAAQQMLALAKLDLLLIVPAFHPPHKTLPPGSPDADGRLELCRLAFSGMENVQVCDLEIRQQGTSYTLLTLRALKIRYPDAQLVLLVGTDMLLSFQSWYCPREILALAELAVLRREEDPVIDTQVREQAQQLRTQMGAVVTIVRNEVLDLSSTQTRNLIALDCMDGCLADEVAQKIRDNHWYRWGENWKQLPFEQLRDVSLSLHKPQRAAHVLGCCRTAEELAVRWGAAPVFAKRAGILHDVTKALTGTQQLQFCKHYRIALTDFEQQNPKLLHAKTGAAAAQYIFGESPEVCRAIYWHTTGRANMELLEKIVYLADYIEPTRCFDGVQRLRELAYSNLDAALLLGFEMSLTLLRSDGKAIDPNSREAWEYLQHERSNQHEIIW